MNHWKYLKYVMRHKWYVLLACFRYGLYWRGLKHDWSKFLPSEWIPYANYFYGKKPPKALDSTGYSHSVNPLELEFNIAWNHHQKRNDHHWQYWLLHLDDGGSLALPMPDKSRREMLADWIGAGKAQGKPETWKWYEANKDKMLLHPDTRVWVEHQMLVLEAAA